MTKKCVLYTHTLNTLQVFALHFDTLWHTLEGKSRAHFVCWRQLPRQHLWNERNVQACGTEIARREIRTFLNFAKWNLIYTFYTFQINLKSNISNKIQNSISCVLSHFLCHPFLLSSQNVSSHFASKTQEILFYKTRQILWAIRSWRSALASEGGEGGRPFPPPPIYAGFRLVGRQPLKIALREVDIWFIMKWNK